MAKLEEHFAETKAKQEGKKKDLANIPLHVWVQLTYAVNTKGNATQ